MYLRRSLLALGLALVWAVPASAASSWSPPVSVSGAGNTVGARPSISIVDGGLGIEAWSETIGGKSVIRVAQHAPGGSWTTLPSDLSSSLPGDACNPVAAIDAAGNALVAWAQYAGPGCYTGNQTILSARRPAGAAGFTAPAVVGAAAGYGNWQSMGTSNAAGQIVIEWSTADATNRFISAAVGSATSGFEAAKTLVTAPLADSLYYPAVAIGPSGDAAVQWQHNAGSNANIEIALHPRGGSFQTTPTAVTTLASPSGASIGAVAIDAAGDVLSAYSYSDGTTSSFASRLRPASNQVWQSQQLIGTPAAGLSASWVTVGLDATGAATAVWVETQFVGSSPYPRRLWGATRAPGAASPWTGQAALTNSMLANYSTPMVAVAPSGAATVGWEVASPANSAQALYRPAGGAFGALTPIGTASTGGAGATVSITSSGDAALSFNGDTNDTRISLFDTTPPTFTAIGVPATGTSGQAVALTATPVDAWSPLAAGQPTWNFGDGTTGSGSSVTHTYATAGAYTVTVAAADANGLAASTTRPITISNPVVPPPPPVPAVTVAKPKVKAAFVASKLVGSLILSGSSPVKTTLTIAVRRHGAKKTSSSNTFAAKAGPWSRVLKLPSGLLPGVYDVIVSGTGVKSSQRSFSLAAPRSGIVTRLYATGPRHGPAATTLVATSELWAHFSFGSLPAKSQTITTQWILPGGRKLSANTRPRTSLVEAQVKDLSGNALPAGRWRCVLSAGGTVVATLNVRLK